MPGSPLQLVELKKTRQTMEEEGNLPDDLMMDILPRLPVKPLMRFKCVCKSWCSHINTSDFVTEQWSNPSLLKDDNILFKCLRDGKPVVSLLSNENGIFRVLEDVVMPFFDEIPLKELTMYGPSNGIVLLHGQCLPDNDNEDRPYCYDYIALWNPATREFKALPMSGLPLPLGQVVAMSSNFGFGLDPKTNDYKVVRILTLKNYQNLVEVYTLSTNSWRRVDTIVPTTVFVPTVQHPAYARGFYYWVARDYHVGGDFEILSFDMSNEVFRTILLPPIDEQQLIEISPLELNGSIGFITLTQMGELLTVWLMKEDGAWVKQSTVALDFGGRKHFLGFSKSGDIFIEKRSCDGNGAELVLYNPRTQELTISHHVRGQYCTMQLIFCSESLVSIKRENELDTITNRVYHHKPSPAEYQNP